MHQRLVTALLLAGSLIGCATELDEADPIEDANQEALDELDRAVLVLPDLIFAPPVVTIQPPFGPPINLPMGATVALPCNTNFMQIKYQYVNAGGAPAGPHHHRSFVVTLPSVVVGRPPINPGMADVASAIHPLAIPPNIPFGLVVMLDNFNVVAELSEGNNNFFGQIVRACPP